MTRLGNKRLIKDLAGKKFSPNLHAEASEFTLSAAELGWEQSKSQINNFSVTLQIRSLVRTGNYRYISLLPVLKLRL